MDTEHGPSTPYDATPAEQPSAAEPAAPPAAGPGPAPHHYRPGQHAYQPAGGPAPMPGLPPAPPPPPPPYWAAWQSGWYGPGGPGYGAPAGQPQRPAKRRRGVIMAAAGTALALAAGGTAWAVVAAGGSPQLSAATIASKTDAGLVDVISTLGYQHGTAEGTGMVLTSNGEVLTNNHVIDGSTSVKVRDIGNGRTYTAKVVGYSDSNDVAVLQLQGASGLSAVSLGSSSGLAPGQRIVALGNAEGRGGTPAVATGKITGLGAAITAVDSGSGQQEHLTGMIQTNAGIEPGDSGGPLVNSSGQVVGMDTAASTSNSQEAGTTAAVQTTAFAIPISHAISIADQIEAGQASGTVHIGETAFLGVGVGSQQSGSQAGGNGQTADGVPIDGVVGGTAAARAGLTGGDTITSVGGNQTTSDSSLQSVIAGYHPGDKVKVTWTNSLGQTESATLTLTSGPAA
jgi:S1-C subfamily serine protease